MASTRYSWIVFISFSAIVEMIRLSFLEIIQNQLYGYIISMTCLNYHFIPWTTYLLFLIVSINVHRYFYWYWCKTAMNLFKEKHIYLWMWGIKPFFIDIRIHSPIWQKFTSSCWWEGERGRGTEREKGIGSETKFYSHRFDIMDVTYTVLKIEPFYLSLQKIT